jgi:serine/threonine protein kinase
MTDWIGRTLSKVEIRQRLGYGGMAEVYLGQHLTLDRPVAVKILHGYLAEDNSSLDRFRTEAQAIAALRHPHIVQVFDFDVIDQRPYIVMELITGLSLAEYLAAQRKTDRRLPPETIARLFVSLAAALDYAHGRGIVHRDIKPSNVMLRCDSGPIDPAAPLVFEVEPVLTDFGIARMLNASVRTQSGMIFGTPAYISPEQASGESVDARSDIYSLSVMLYEMLAGRPLFEVAGTETPLALLLKHIAEPPPRLPQASSILQAILDRGLAKKREERYQHAGDLAAELLVGIFGTRSISAVTASPALPLTGVIEVLELLIDQARAYEHALPPNNYPARAVVAALSQLGRQALNEARDAADALKPTPPAPHPFSPREFEVLTLAAEGLTNKEIAYRLGLSERTVQFHMNSIFNKTTTQSRTEAVALALRNNWLAPSKR